jgi:hypothetical protein
MAKLLLAPPSRELSEKHLFVLAGKGGTLVAPRSRRKASKSARVGSLGRRLGFRNGGRRLELISRHSAVFQPQGPAGSLRWKVTVFAKHGANDAADGGEAVLADQLDRALIDIAVPNAETFAVPSHGTPFCRLEGIRMTGRLGLGPLSEGLDSFTLTSEPQTSKAALSCRTTMSRRSRRVRQLRH